MDMKVAENKEYLDRDKDGNLVHLDYFYSKYDYHINIKTHYRKISNFILTYLLSNLRMDNRDKCIAYEIVTGDKTMDIFIKRKDEEDSNIFPFIYPLRQEWLKDHFNIKNDLKPDIDNVDTVVVTITPTNDTTISLLPYISDVTHLQLQGFKEYIDSEILLNYDEERLIVAFGGESIFVPLIIFFRDDDKFK